MYTKLGRQTYFDQWTPLKSRIDALNTRCLEYHYTKLVRSFVCNTKRPSVKQSIKLQMSSNLADEPSSANGPPADEPSSANGTPPTSKTSTWQTNLLWPMDPPPCTSKTSTWQTNLLWLMDPQQSRIDACNTGTQYLADKCTLAGLVVKNCNFTLLLTSSGHEW